MRLVEIFRICLLAIFCVQGLVYAQNKEVNKGAFILISYEGEVRYYLNEVEDFLLLKQGEVIPSTHSIETGVDGKLVGLLSNGTLLTLVENTRMKVATFEQTPFVDDGRKLADLNGEPSQSEIALDLDFGSLVVKTKKLNKDSTFDIHSPFGAAGIRGTEFQMAANPGAGVQLDVTESTVAFTPSGGGQAIPVSQGNGLSVSPSGVPTSRPVNPVVANQITSTNQAATEATQDISLGEVVVAVEKAGVQQDDPASAESSSDEESVDSASEEEASTEEPADSNSDSNNDTESESGAEKGEGDTPDSKVKEDEPSQKTESSETKDSPKAEQGTKENSELPTSTQAKAKSQLSVQQPDKSLLLENNPELKKNQQLSKFGLTSEQIERYDQLPGKVRTYLLDQNPDVVKRLLSVSGFVGEKSERYINHDAEIRRLLLTMNDEVFLSLLDPNVDKVFLKEALQKINLGAVRPENVPKFNQSAGLNARAIALGNRLKENENTQLMDELLEMSGGQLDEFWINIGEVAEVLSRSLEVSDFTAMPGFSAQQVWENPFFTELANVYDQLELDGLVNGASMVMGADHLIVSENAQALGSFFTNGVEEIVLLSRDSMQFRGDFHWESQSEGDSRLVLMSADKFTVPEGVTLKSATSDLVIATRQDLLLSKVNLEAVKNVSIRGMRDVHLKQVGIKANVLATIKARRDMNVDGLSFNQDISRIVMEAQTMRLRNVNFPSAAQIRLNSLKGAIDGRYPNFGNVSAAQQIGRVNFIENVRSGTNLLHDRPSFDLHGKNIKIGKIVRP